VDALPAKVKSIQVKIVLKTSARLLSYDLPVLDAVLLIVRSALENLWLCAVCSVQADDRLLVDIAKGCKDRAQHVGANHVVIC
jgi:hypothetical protein